METLEHLPASARLDDDLPLKAISKAFDTLHFYADSLSIFITYIGFSVNKLVFEDLVSSFI